MERKPHNKRKTGKEQYYTPLETAIHCFNVIAGKVDNLERTWLEPGGGTGSFIEAMIRGGIDASKIVSYDIEPKHHLIKGTKDFLKEDITRLKGCITLTNPPFGRSNKLAIPFFNKCAQVSDYVGFVVPKSWRKWSILNRLDKRFHLIYDEELHVNYLCDDPKDRKGKLATVFQVYQRRDFDRKIVKVEDRGYIVKTTPEEADVSLTIFGQGCGTVNTDFPRVKNTTKMFLKVSSPRVLDALSNVEYSKFYNNVAFTEALSIQEINYLLNEFFDSQG